MNRQILSYVMKCIEFCGHQGIPLRGPCDNSTNSDSDANLGNFKALIQFWFNSVLMQMQIATHLPQMFTVILSQSVVSYYSE